FAGARGLGDRTGRAPLGRCVQRAHVHHRQPRGARDAHETVVGEDRGRAHGQRHHTLCEEGAHYWASSMPRSASTASIASPKLMPAATWRSIGMLSSGRLLNSSSVLGFRIERTIPLCRLEWMYHSL